MIRLMPIGILALACFCYLSLERRAVNIRGVTHFSGNWNNGLHTGTFYWNVNNDSSNANRNNGSHLLVCSKKNVVKC